MTLRARLVAVRVATGMPMATPGPNGQTTADGYQLELAPVTDANSGWLGTGSSINLVVRDMSEYRLGDTYDLNLTKVS